VFTLQVQFPFMTEESPQAVQEREWPFAIYPGQGRCLAQEREPREGRQTNAVTSSSPTVQKDTCTGSKGATMAAQASLSAESKRDEASHSFAHNLP
jgi:hypothetical protein